MTPPDLKLTSDVFWRSSVLFAVLDLFFVSLLWWRIKPKQFGELKGSLAIASAIYWGAFGTALVWGFWDLYYRHFFADSMRWLAPLNAILYGAIGFALWWLANHLPVNPVLGFGVLGAVEGVLEHVWGIYGLRVLDQVPLLQAVSPLSVLIFSFFEYVLYWEIVLGFAALVTTALRRLTGLHRQQAPSSETWKRWNCTEVYRR